MASFTNVHGKSWTWAIVIGLGLTAAWGVYAWVFKSEPPQNESEPPEAIASVEDDARSDAVDSGESLTSLRATRLARGASGREGRPPAMSAKSRSGVALQPEIAPTAIPQAHPTRSNQAEPWVSSEPSTNPRSEMTAGHRALSAGDFVAARSAFSRALGGGLPATEQRTVRDELSRLADAMLFSRAAGPSDPLTDIHVVKSGQSLDIIARRYQVTKQLLASINRIANPDRIRVGARLKVIHGPFHAVIWKSQHRMDIRLGHVFVRSFRVGLGVNGGTPLGLWIINSKLENPDWTDPRDGQHYLGDDPNNPIGEHWIGMECVDGECLGRTGFGIHGTIDPGSIGENMSMGCVRLTPEDVDFLYDLLVQKQSRIEIRP